MLYKYNFGMGQGLANSVLDGGLTSLEIVDVNFA